MIWNPKTALIVSGFVALSAIAAAGWMHHPGTSAVATAPVANSVPLDQYGVPQSPVAAPQYSNNGDTTASAGYQAANYSPDDDRYLLSTRNPVRVVRAQPAPPMYAQAAPPPAYVEEGSADRYVETEHHDRHHHHGVKRALAYTAGGAGVGAAIGAIAGGGKGAGIGALAGGAGGFIYDRVRH
jgi:hypothetical protein